MVDHVHFLKEVRKIFTEEAKCPILFFQWHGTPKGLLETLNLVDSYFFSKQGEWNTFIETFISISRSKRWRAARMIMIRGHNQDGKRTGLKRMRLEGFEGAVREPQRKSERADWAGKVETALPFCHFSLWGWRCVINTVWRMCVRRGATGKSECAVFLVVLSA